MSNSQNTENEQQNNLCTTLTEQWKKGELEEWHYYYLKDNEYIFIDCFNGVSFEKTCDFEIKEVLAPVPSYEEWNQLRKFLEEFNALDVAKENQQLKELLLECSEFLYEILSGTHSKLSFKLESGIRKQYYMISLSELKTKIDNAIGEK
jgi:hypothetical protein